ncbi:DnaJ domain-containing protein [Aspergillus sp. HF37]|nr:DnaJ domain-containing protein [Aspergillus sp. HF37]
MLPRVRPQSSFFFVRTRSHKPAFAFSTTTPRPASEKKTYYEILDVPVTASTSEIKKQFYTLSLRHHPDRNRSDPTASERFAHISSAYQVLGDTGKRAVYDRDNGIHTAAGSRAHPAAAAAAHGGSYSSSSVYNKGGSYAGSRPASGLSKRRGAFRGPPPSFYAHGGFGDRRARQPPPPGAGNGNGGTEKDEDDPTAFIDHNPVYHFNARGHFRTQTAEDRRRRARQSRAMGDAFREHQVGTSGDVLVRFILVCGMLAGTVFIPGLFWSSHKRDSDQEKVRRP